VSQELSEVYLGISKALNYLPGKASSHFSWRLHPKDFETVLQQLRQDCLHRDMVFLPGGALYIAGVRVFKDYDAPLLEFSTTAETK
jgi:hypothetical protein